MCFALFCPVLPYLPCFALLALLQSAYRGLSGGEVQSWHGFAGGGTAGLFTGLMMNPVDVVKTVIQRQEKAPAGQQAKYTSTLQVRLFLSLCLHLYLYLFICLSVYLFICLSVCPETKYTFSTLQCAGSLLKEAGPGVFFRGVVPRCAKIVPGQAIIFGMMDVANKSIDSAAGDDW